MENYFGLVVLPNLGEFLGVLCILVFLAGLVGLIITTVVAVDAGNKKELITARGIGRVASLLMLSAIFFGLIACFIPNKDDAIKLEHIRTSRR